MCTHVYNFARETRDFVTFQYDIETFWRQYLHSRSLHVVDRRSHTPETHMQCKNFKKTGKRCWRIVVKEGVFSLRVGFCWLAFSTGLWSTCYFRILEQRESREFTPCCRWRLSHAFSQTNNSIWQKINPVGVRCSKLVLLSAGSSFPKTVLSVILVWISTDGPVWAVRFICPVKCSCVCSCWKSPNIADPCCWYHSTCRRHCQEQENPVALDWWGECPKCCEHCHVFHYYQHTCCVHQ